MRRALVAACLLATSIESGAVGAQVVVAGSNPPASTNRWMIDVSGMAAQPIAEFRTQVTRAWGAGAAVRHHFRAFAPLGLRGDFAFLNYGNERKRVPVSPTLNRVLVDMNTTNNIVLVSGGPELMIMRGPVRPYVYAFAGYSYFYTETSADTDDGGSFARSTNFGDGGLAIGWGGGLNIPLRIGSAVAALDAGARLTKNGTRTYLRRGDIFDQPDGSLQFNPRTTPADFVQYHVGVTFSPRQR